MKPKECATKPACLESADGWHKPQPEGHSTRTGVVFDHERRMIVVTMLCGACWREGSATFPIEDIVWR